MYVPSLRTGLAALAALGGFAAMAHAQLPPAPVAPAAPVPVAPAVAGAPQVIKWPGGYMVMNGPEVIMRTTGPAGSSTSVVTGSGNGVGNRIVVSGGAGGTTIVQNSRNGIGNRLITNPDDVLIDVDALIAGLKPLGVKPVAPGVPVVPVIPPAAPVAPAVPVVVAPAPGDPKPVAQDTMPSYKGKASPFWTKKAFSDAYDCNIYWCPTTKMWFRYGAEDDTYRPVPVQPAAPTDMK